MPDLTIVLVLAVGLALTSHSGGLPTLAMTLVEPDCESTFQNDEPGITVMTLNLGSGLVDPADLVSYLREIDADIVALLEVTPDIASALETEVGDIFPYREVRALGIPGKGLLSSHPIVRVDWLELNPGRPDLLVTLDLAGRPIEVLVAHPPPPEFEGLRIQQREGTVGQFDRIIEVAAEAQHPFLLVGDLNVISVQQRYYELESINLQDVFESVGCGPGFTFPERISPLPESVVFPFLRIDYIWASEEWRAHAASLGEDIGSDHLPVIAHIELVTAAVANNPEVPRQGRANEAP